ncbi:MAG: hypothetical protein GX251_10800 [Firmicutes bacterium]|nr:hypothetical protein [Bacillota bacterium]
MDPCKIEWLTVPAPDLGAAKKFYETVFGFSVSPFSERFWVFQSGTLKGGLDADLTPNGQGIGFSITVPAINRALEAIERGGGSIVEPGYSLGSGAGFCAKFKDPNGNVLELYSDRLNLSELPE